MLLIVDGLHVPLIPLVDVPGNAGTTPPLHIASPVPKENVGVTLGITFTVIVVAIPQLPELGVNV